jgi:hypothetical protein
MNRRSLMCRTAFATAATLLGAMTADKPGVPQRKHPGFIPQRFSRTRLRRITVTREA